ncbi:MAG: rhodanese-like domain-containing protein [Marinosulfonomonas sp.]|nr:rhodanese-like domain-containing protein [Marinosulfonomonas sp.]
MFVSRALHGTAMIGAATLMIGAGGVLADSHSPMPDAEFLTTWQQTFDGLRDMSPKWGKQGVDAFKALQDAGVPVIYLDIRTEKEWQDGVIEGALLINLNDLPIAENLARLPEDRNTIIAVYCKAGHRSTLAMTMLHQLGYKNAISMSGGMTDWQKADYPVIPAPE